MPTQKTAEGPARSTMTPGDRRPERGPDPQAHRQAPDRAHARGGRERVADDPVGQGEDTAGDPLQDAPEHQQRQGLPDRAHDRATQKMAITHVSTRPRPNRSPSRPMSGVATEAATRYAVRSQDTASGLAPSSRTSAGSAGRISVWESA